MKREIKFRALYDDMGGGWKYGMLIYEGEVPRVQEKGTMLFSTCLKGTESQFIGLLDKNGKEIYEGDIITHPRHSRPYSSKAKVKQVVCVVEWREGNTSSKELNPQMNENPSLFNKETGFCAHPIDETLPESKWGYNWSVFHDCEIIGNIYENPELTTP